YEPVSVRGAVAPDAGRRAGHRSGTSRHGPRRDLPRLPTLARRADGRIKGPPRRRLSCYTAFLGRLPTKAERRSIPCAAKPSSPGALPAGVAGFSWGAAWERGLAARPRLRDPARARTGRHGRGLRGAPPASQPPRRPEIDVGRRTGNAGTVSPVLRRG